MVRPLVTHVVHYDVRGKTFVVLCIHLGETVQPRIHTPRIWCPRRWQVYDNFISVDIDGTQLLRNVTEPTRDIFRSQACQGKWLYHIRESVLEHNQSNNDVTFHNTSPAEISVLTCWVFRSPRDDECCEDIPDQQLKGSCLWTNWTVWNSI